MSAVQGPSLEDIVRNTRLDSLFNSVNNGDRGLKTLREGNRYLEAVCCQSDAGACIERIVHSRAGLSALQSSICFDLSSTFLNGSASALLSYLEHPTLEVILEGALLRQVLLSIADTRLFWDALVQSYRKEELLLPAKASFGWLLVQLMCLPEPQCTGYHNLARNLQIQDSFLKSSELRLRTIGSRIKHILSISASPTINDAAGGAGGRHDNDFADFRQIAILPTADELVSKEAPFLRLAESIEDPDLAEHRLAMHLDNQFRLYREDMLGELREEIQIALGQKKGRHRGVVIKDLTCLSVDCGTDTRRQSWGLRLQCKRDLPQLRNLNPKDRKAAIESNHSLLRHQSLTCLALDGQITAFPWIHRDTELLASTPPVITVRFSGSAIASIAKTLLKLKTCDNIKLIQIDTAVFAYEPILQGLQRMKTLPLVDEILFWSTGSDLIQPPNPPSRIIEALEQRPGEDIQGVVGSSKSIVLDRSQNSSLVAALKQRVSLVQGPPGWFNLASYSLAVLT